MGRANSPYYQGAGFLLFVVRGHASFTPLFVHARGVISVYISPKYIKIYNAAYGEMPINTVFCRNAKGYYIRPAAV